MQFVETLDGALVPLSRIGFQRLFSVGSAVDVIEQKAGQLASRGFAII